MQGTQKRGRMQCAPFFYCNEGYPSFLLYTWQKSGGGILPLI